MIVAPFREIALDRAPAGELCESTHDNPWRVRLFPAVDRGLTTAFKALNAIHRGIWLGLLDRNSLHRITARQYERWTKYQRDDYNRSGLRTWEEGAIESFFGDCGSVLVAAAGGGREMIALAKRGIRVDGFDCSQKLVESSRCRLATAAPGSRLVLAAPDEVPKQLGRYDGAVFGWGGYTHIPGSATRTAMLRDLKSRLRPEAPILLSFFTRSKANRQLGWTCRIANAVRRLRRCESVELGDTLDRTFDHFFTRHEVESEMHAGGFDVVSYTDDTPPHGYAVGLARG